MYVCLYGSILSGHLFILSVRLVSCLWRSVQCGLQSVSTCKHLQLSGSLLLLFVRHELHGAVQEYSASVVGDLPIAAVRFRFHQSTIAIVCGKLETDNEELLWQSLEESSDVYTKAARAFTCADPQASADSEGEIGV